MFRKPILRAFGATNIGQRERNEDFFLIDETMGFFVVADGMGGHTAGNFASCFTSGRMKKIFEKAETLGSLDIEYSNLGIKSADRKVEPEEYIRFAIWDANKKLFEESSKRGFDKKMGTTIVGAFFWAHRVFLFNVGDSRAYRIYRGSIQQMTTDHSAVERRVQAGEITPDEARTAKGRNIITRAVGAKERTQPDTHSIGANTGDRFLLCSDGLSNMVAAESEKDLSMKDFVFEPDIKKACNGIVELARERGGKDNITAVIIEVMKGGEDVDLPASFDLDNEESVGF